MCLRRVPVRGVAWLEQRHILESDGERPNQIKEGTESRQRLSTVCW